ncbi:NXPE family member 3-like [Ptychodera flava]|uniref:NXPE family member 3-like n=1 Tax=Ptychodera flava TaxID=63121 RepID=UPI00396A17A6
MKNVKALRTTIMRPWSLIEISRVLILIFGIVLGALIQEMYWHGQYFRLNTAKNVRNENCVVAENNINSEKTELPKLISEPNNLSMDIIIENGTNTRKGKPFTPFLRKLTVTSAAKSRITLQRKGKGKKSPAVFKGEILNVTIQTYDAYGRHRTVGGDFFFAVMLNTKLQKSTPGRIIDHNDGSYTVQFYAGWAGPASIVVTLVHPREAVNWIETVYRPKERCVEWRGTFKNETIAEQSTCYVFRGQTVKSKCVYSNKNSLGNTAFVCDEPKHLLCMDIQSVLTNLSKIALYVKQTLSDEEEFLFERPYLMTPLVGSPLNIKITESKVGNLDSKLPSDALRSCGPELSIPVSDGFWYSKKKWSSLACKARHWNAVQALRCLTKKTVYFFGDSTIGQLYKAVNDALNITSKKTGRYSQYSNESTHNVSLFSYFHAITVGSGVVDFWSQNFESDIIDDIGDTTCDLVIVISLSYHYSYWTKVSYEERLLRLRQSIIRLKTRCPDITVIVKSSHPREHKLKEAYIYNSDWILFDMNNMMRDIFKGMGVSFLNVFDMSLAHFSKNTVHMPQDPVIRQQADLLFSYICPQFVD